MGTKDIARIERAHKCGMPIEIKSWHGGWGDLAPWFEGFHYDEATCDYRIKPGQVRYQSRTFADGVWGDVDSDLGPSFIPEFLTEGLGVYEWRATPPATIGNEYPQFTTGDRVRFKRDGRLGSVIQHENGASFVGVQLDDLMHWGVSTLGRCDLELASEAKQKEVDLSNPVRTNAIDPNARMKRAHAKGMPIEFRDNLDKNPVWHDIGNPNWHSTCDYRVKPGEVSHNRGSWWLPIEAFLFDDEEGNYEWRAKVEPQATAQVKAQQQAVGTAKTAMGCDMASGPDKTVIFIAAARKAAFDDGKAKGEAMASAQLEAVKRERDDLRRMNTTQRGIIVRQRAEIAEGVTGIKVANELIKRQREDLAAANGEVVKTRREMSELRNEVCVLKSDKKTLSSRVVHESIKRQVAEMRAQCFEQTASCLQSQLFAKA